MRRRHLFPLAVLANASMLLLCLASRYDTIPIVIFLPLFHIALFILNCTAADRWWQVILLDVEHIAATVGTIVLDARLYGKYVSDDLESAVFSAIALEIGFAITVIGFIIHMVVFARRQQGLRRRRPHPGHAGL